MSLKTTGLFAVTFVLGAAGAAELVVPDAFPTIQKAVDAAKAGDVVTVKAGTYGGFSVGKAYEGAPLTVRAAKGARVVISGFAPVTDWKDEGNGVYSAKTKSAVKHLFVGMQPQQCARWPADGTRLAIVKADTPTRTFKTEPVKGVPALDALAKDVKSAVCFYYFAKGNGFGSPSVEAYDAATGDIRFDAGNWNKWIGPDNNRYSFMNHPALIAQPGDWAFVYDVKGDKRNTAGTVYFKPAQKADLAKVQYPEYGRPLVNVGHWKDRVCNVVIDGFEVTGGAAEGVKIGGDDVTVQNCLVHHNGQNGIAARGVRNVTIRSNVSLANFNGIGLASVEKGLVEGNEVAHNVMDGLIVAGNISGRKTGEPGANPPTRGVTVRRNYLHHHFQQGHPDNFQMYRDVFDTKIEENFDVWGGQSLMAEEVEGVEFNGNVFMGCEAMMVICGHGNSNKWNFRNNTFWGPGYGVFSFTGHDYLVEKNLFVGCAIPYGAPTAKVVSRENFFSPSYVGKTTNPWRTYTDLAKAESELGHEKGSAQGDAKIANFPVRFAVGIANGSACDSLALRKDAAADAFVPGDQVELNGDGRLRTVVSYADKVLTFRPALPIPPFRGVMVANWKNAKSTRIDNRAQVQAGATISTVDFAAGDLLGKGTRTLPVIPEDVLAAMPDPNRVICPPAGH